MHTSGLQCAGWKPWRRFNTEQGLILITWSWHECWQLRGEGSCIFGRRQRQGNQGCTKGEFIEQQFWRTNGAQWRGEHSRREGSRCGGTVGRLWAASRVGVLFCEWQAKPCWCCGSVDAVYFVYGPTGNHCSQAFVCLVSTAWTHGKFFLVCASLLPQMRNCKNVTVCSNLSVPTIKLRKGWWHGLFCDGRLMKSISSEFWLLTGS